MKQLFQITGTEAPSADDVLICELSHYHICLAHLADSSIHSIAYFESATPLTQSHVSSVLEKATSHTKSFKTLLIGSAFPDYSMVPQNVAEEKDLDSFLKYSGSSVQQDFVPAQQVQLLYNIPPYFAEIFEAYPSVQTMHVHAAALKADDLNKDGNYLYLHFTSKEFRVLVMKEGQLQLAQIYPFAAPLDVVYYLLMISAQYDLPQAQTTIVLSGLVDERSALYKELFQYYNVVEFAAPSNIALPPTEYHPHYFSSILNLAACASLVAH